METISLSYLDSLSHVALAFRSRKGAQSSVVVGNSNSSPWFGFWFGSQRLNGRDKKHWMSCLAEINRHLAMGNRPNLVWMLTIRSRPIKHKLTRINPRLQETERKRRSREQAVGMTYVRCARCTGNPAAGAAAGKGRRRPRAGGRVAARRWWGKRGRLRRGSRGAGGRGGGAGPRRALLLSPPSPPPFASSPLGIGFGCTQRFRLYGIRSCRITDILRNL